ncbi:MAG TPA: hydroxymethylbilane synthase [Sphingomicrobium sp.]|nr:hydroxymethylbilane synthase [Sphingomicrobium sp.]
MHRCPILGTRGSPLAMAQATKVASALEVANRWAAGDVQIVTITTSGDRIQDRPLADIGGKALWTKELDKALLDGVTDFSVHSLKDVESDRPRGIQLAAVRPRADVRDRIIGAPSIAELKRGAVVGTSSPRRQAQLLALRPDLRIVPLRGNVDTRLGKLEAGDMDAIILAAAGLIRLGRKSLGAPIPIAQMLPAPGQAVIAMECRADDTLTVLALRLVDDAATHAAIDAERAFTAALGATCHSPVAALATIDRGRIRLRAQLLAEDGSASIADETRFEIGEIGAAAAFARAMLERAPAAIRTLFDAA